MSAMDVEASPSTSPPTTSSAPALTPPDPTSPSIPQAPAVLNPAQQQVHPGALLGLHSAATDSCSEDGEPSTNLVHTLILSYLIHNCYEKTALALLSTSVDAQALGVGNKSELGSISPPAPTPALTPAVPASPSAQALPVPTATPASAPLSVPATTPVTTVTVAPTALTPTPTTENTTNPETDSSLTTSNNNTPQPNIPRQTSTGHRDVTGAKEDVSQIILQKLERTYHLAGRRKMMACIQNGEIQTALSLADSMLKLCNPATTLRESRPEMYMQTLCQHYVELIRSKDNLEALYFARSTMRPFMTEFKDAFQLMQPYMPLMAYEKPEESPCFDLLHLSQRADLAQSINGCVMASLASDKSELCTVPVLERILRQLVLVMRRLKGQPWSIASVWQVDDDNDAKMES